MQHDTNAMPLMLLKCHTPYPGIFFSWASFWLQLSEQEVEQIVLMLWWLKDGHKSLDETSEVMYSSLSALLLDQVTVVKTDVHLPYVGSPENGQQ